MADPIVLVNQLSQVLLGLAPDQAARDAVTAAQGQMVTAVDAVQAVTPASTQAEVTAAAQAYADAKQTWDQARDLVAAGDPTRLLQPVIDLVPLPGLRELLAGVTDQGVDRQMALGPLVVDLKVPPADVIISMATALPAPPLTPAFLGYQAPDSVGLDLALPPMGGGGFLQAQANPLHLAGVIELRLGVVDVHAFGIIERTPGGDLSVLVLLGAHFFPGIQLSFGFAIGAIGGLVGVNRAIDVDAARRRLSDGGVTDALFPDDPVRKAPQLLATLGELFPARAGSFVFGPTFQLNWGQVSPTGPAIAQADIGVLIELPGPRRVVIVGRIQLNLPPGPIPLAHLELDVLGVLDLQASLVSIDASLVRSNLLAIFRITGDAAFRLSWGSRPYLLLSIGGFHPSFTPEPGIGRSLSRLALSLDNPISGVYLRAEGYFAVTTNTLQFGGRIETGIGAAGVEAGGFVALDAIASYRPFHFEVDFSAGFSVSFEGEDLGSISVSGTISGPGPLTISASLTISILFFDISWNETFTLPPAVDQPAATASLRQAVQDQLARSANLRGGDIVDPAVRMVANASASDDPQVALVAPTGTLRWSQSTVPFETTVLRLDGADLADPGSVTLTPAGAALADQGPSREWFSPAGYRKLTSAEAVNQPSYAELSGGRVFTFQSAQGTDAVASTDFVAYVRGPDGAVAPVLTPSGVTTHHVRLLRSLAGRGAPAACTDLSPAVTVDASADVWTVAGGGSRAAVSSETEAHTQVALAAPSARWAPQRAVVRDDDHVNLGGVL